MRRSPVLLSRLEVEQYIVELPPMSAERVAAALGYRLPSLYPGSRDRARLDYLRNGRKAGSYLLFVADEDELAARRAEAEGRPFLSPTLVAAELAPRGPWTCLFWTELWASLDRFEDGTLVDSRRLLRKSEAREDLRRLLGEPPSSSENGAEGEGGERFCAIVDEGVLGEAATPGCAIRCALGELGLGEALVLPLASVLPRVRAARAVVFPLRPRSRRARLYAVAAAACLDLLLALALAARVLGGLDAELSAVREDCLRLQQGNGEALRLVEEAEAKEKRYAELVAEEVPDMYAVVAAVAANVGPGCGILSLVAQEGEFRAEAEGPDALATLAALEGSGAFESVKLRESLPGAGGGERFSISGRWRSEARGQGK